MSELLPCPFCGGEAVIVPTLDTTVREWFVTCGNLECNVLACRTKRYYTEAEAIAAWNSRAERTYVPTEDGFCPYCGDDLIRCDMAIGEGGGAVELDPPIYHNYCPNCGCKVQKVVDR